ncbi:MAG TPA: restriction endonuclease [Umezawaea sp.]|nr:restriction endonuclease [Umezawaea sp.]
MAEEEPHPYDLEPIKPLLDFDLSKFAFVEGMDAVVVNQSTLVGGLSIVQAKRYSKVVGVNHVRELAGAVEEKKAGRGILVTTSWFAKGCRTKAREHGRIDGAELKHLLKEHLGEDTLIGIEGRPANSGSTS